jgi:hypothetical protein
VWLAGVAEGEGVGGAEESGDDGSGERVVGGEFGELRIHGADEGLGIEMIDVATHERAERCGGLGDGIAVAGDVGDEEAGDASGGAGGEVVDVAAGFCGGEGLGVDLCVESGEGDVVGGGCLSTPDFHAGHELW